jgi:hypothetical protein
MSPGKTAKSPYKTAKPKAGFSCKSTSKVGKKPMFKLNKEVKFVNLPNVVGKSIASPSKKIKKRLSKRPSFNNKGGRSNKSRGDNTGTNRYNKKVKEGNTCFTSTLREKLKDDIYEESSPSNSAGTFESRKSIEVFQIDDECKLRTEPDEENKSD